MRYTISEIAGKLDVNKEHARGLVKYLVADGLVRDMGVRKSETGGRGENLYSFVDEFEKVLASRLRRAKF